MFNFMKMFVNLDPVELRRLIDAVKACGYWANNVHMRVLYGCADKLCMVILDEVQRNPEPATKLIEALTACRDAYGAAVKAVVLEYFELYKQESELGEMYVKDIEEAMDNIVKDKE